MDKHSPARQPAGQPANQPAEIGAAFPEREIPHAPLPAPLAPLEKTRGAWMGSPHPLRQELTVHLAWVVRRVPRWIAIDQPGNSRNLHHKLWPRLASPPFAAVASPVIRWPERHSRLPMIRCLQLCKIHVHMWCGNTLNATGESPPK